MSRTTEGTIRQGTRRLRGARVLLAAAVVLAAPLGVPAPAHASTNRPQGGLCGPQAGACSWFAGYAAWAWGFTRLSLTTKIIVPAIKTCGSRKTTIIPTVLAWGSGGRGGGSAAAGLFIGCLNGKPRYFPFFTVIGASRRFPRRQARPGDKVVLHEDWTPQRVLVSVVDKTHPRVSKTLTGRGALRESYPTIGDSGFAPETPGGTAGPRPVPDFAKVTFSNSKRNGRPFRFTRGLARFDMVDSSTLKIKASPFRSDHETFTTIFKHS